MADFSADSFVINSCAKQHEGMKSSAPRWGMGTASRDQVKKVYISETHTQDILGTHSPGPVYEPANKTPGPKWGFAKSSRFDYGSKVGGGPRSYPATSNDLLQIPLPGADSYKHDRAGRPKFGTALRTAPVNAPGLDGFAPGTESPGPAQYTANFYAANKAPPKYTMASKTKMGASKYEVRPGPQAYSLPPGTGVQPNARKPTKPMYSFSKTPR